MQQIKKALITNIVLMVICLVLLGYNAFTFGTCVELLHKGDWSVLAAIIFIPFFLLVSLATFVMGAIQVSISIRNLVKVRSWYTILLLVVSCVILIAPVVFVVLLFVL